ncbi:MAG: ChaN family lipoprotein [Desulfobulbaceae bacterium]|nr:ChaN family lipoprotein [Desulfobulbaceae bacterium]
MKKIAAFSLVLSALLLTYSLAFAESKILDVPSGKIIPFSEMIQGLQKANYIFLGDDITVTGHQIAQMEILKGIHEKNKQLAVGVEMFRNESQYILDQWSTNEIKKRRFVDEFNSNWGEWDRYKKLFQYIWDNRVKLAALNISRDILIQVESKGFDSLSPDQLGGLYEGITCDVVPSYQDVMRRMNLYKGMLQEQSFKNHCEMKILGDIMMAKNLVEFHNKNPALTMIVLAGNTHSWKHGIPSRINNQAGNNFKTILFEAAGRVNRNTVTAADADYLWLDYGATGWRR